MQIASAIRSILVPVLGVSCAAVQADHPSFGLGSGVSGPIHTLSPNTLARGSWVGGLRFETTQQDTFSAAALEGNAITAGEVHNVDAVNVMFLGLGYGISDNLTISASLPWITRDNIIDADLEDVGPPPDVHVETLGDISGVGDLTVLGQYRLVGDAQTRFAAALLTGLRVPTGSTRERTDDGARFAAEFQPGSGAWSPLIGASFQQRFARTAVTASLLYTITHEGSQQTDLGDVFNYDLAWVWRLSGHDETHVSMDSHHSHADWDLVLELNGEWRDQQRQAGLTDSNTGGNLMYLSPGVRVGSGLWSGFASLSIPVVESLNGVQNEPDWRFTFGVGRRL